LEACLWHQLCSTNLLRLCLGHKSECSVQSLANGNPKARKQQASWPLANCGHRERTFDAKWLAGCSFALCSHLPIGGQNVISGHWTHLASGAGHFCDSFALFLHRFHSHSGVFFSLRQCVGGPKVQETPLLRASLGKLVSEQEAEKDTPLLEGKEARKLGKSILGVICLARLRVVVWSLEFGFGFRFQLETEVEL